MRLFLALVIGLIAGPAAAQDWATREVCTVDEARIHDEVFAPTIRAALEAEAALIENRRGRFWQVTAPNGARSYLWGTFHSSDPLILDLPEAVEEAVSAARVVAVEVDFTTATREAYRDAIYFEGHYKEAGDPFAATEGEGTIAGLSEEMSQWVRGRAFELGWSEDDLLVLSTAGIAELLLSDPCEDFFNGVIPIQDDYIQLLGRLAGAEIMGLEAEADFFDDLKDRPETAEAIIAVYTSYLRPTYSNRERSTSFAIYREGRLGLMFAWENAFLASVLGPRAGEALRLTDDYLIAFRNERFLRRLAAELPEGGVFVAVGAAHLPGRLGLVAKLRKQGYEVTRLPTPGEAP